MASKVVCAILLGFVYSCTLATASYGAQEEPISVVLKGRVVCDACSSHEKNILDISDIISGMIYFFIFLYKCRSTLFFMMLN